MNRQQLYIAGAALLATLALGACTAGGKATLDPNQVNISTTLDATQQRLQDGCLGLRIASIAFDGATAIPSVAAKLQPEQLQAGKDASAAIDEFCGTPDNPVNVKDPVDAVKRIDKLISQIKAIVENLKAAPSAPAP